MEDNNGGGGKRKLTHSRKYRVLYNTHNRKFYNTRYIKSK